MKILYFLLISNYLYAQTTFAVVVGISNYQSVTYSKGDLKFADADALRYTEFLMSKIGGNVAIQNIVFLKNSKATKQAILKAMQIFTKAKNNDKIIFYFSGHGLEGSLVAYDSSTEPKSVISYDEIRAAFKASKAQNKLCIADACYSGGIKGNKTTPKQVENKENVSVNVAMILSSRSTQPSIEDARINGGIFTFFLINGLSGYADTNHDKRITIKELYNYLSPKIKKATPNQQAPVFAGQFADDWILAKY